MAKKFSLSEGMLNGISKNTEKLSTLEAKENFKIEYIDIDNIVRNEKNFYEIVDIEDLAEDISINGLNHNLVVRPIKEGKYEIISGERRYTALKELVDKGDEKFKKVPCKISDLNDLDSEIVLIQSNAQSRELSETDKLKQVQRLTELYKLKKQKGETVGRIREIISKDTGLSPTQVGRYTTINKNLIPELKSVLEQGKLTINNASEFAVLSEENQRVILDIINSEVSISKNEANNLKNEFKRLEKEKEDLLKQREEYLKEIQKLSSENEKKSDEINKEIEKIKDELDKKYTNENIDIKDEIELKEEKLIQLENDKWELEKEKSNLIEKLNTASQNLDNEVNKIANEKAKEIATRFERDKSTIEKENKELKKELESIKQDESVISINQELKIRLKNVRREMNKVTGLMANNTIIDEVTLKEIDSLKSELEFLNEQLNIYINQGKMN
ncbi:ParB protein [[Clostridium] sordellii]|uniref:ParB protein n=1 Tax=Paraclostridium sordellii TaxID=1505 RepID=A0ABM9RTP1_PARSO|nr:ParB N-terminal domain-containing protein [Paeniclostridium sordellii]TAN66412.1 chromosome partitioning protein ParB [Paeniclostridium sordellii 8483]CEJ75460.1 ParB protein (plasmid) [[Clostridium] sordellii] [Paeniclostridium sordellii]CEN22417.1 ParB protein [[Clostridium] sordellii] [Paeniclostridium sordellii]CEN29778.1 ParB protein [[Clostridium] sordellii] [Paeniclostridium sordellii]